MSEQEQPHVQEHQCNTGCGGCFSEGYNSALAELQAKGVKVSPYLDEPYMTHSFLVTNNGAINVMSEIETETLGMEPGKSYLLVALEVSDAQ